MTMHSRICPPTIANADDFNAEARRCRWPALCDPDCRFIYPKLGELLALWRGLAGENGIPYRREMTARRLKPHLKSIFIYERVDGADGGRRYRVRLMGSKLVQFFGEFTGKFLDETIPEEFLPRWHALHDAALGSGAPVRLLIRSDTFEKSHIVAEYLCAPLRANDGEVNLVLVAGRHDGTLCWSELYANECRLLGMEPAAVV